jgi:hypothetical protein
MAKSRYVPRADILLDNERKEIANVLSDLKKTYEKIVGFEIDGPYVIAGYKIGESFERIDPIVGYSVGLPYAHVLLSVDQTIQDQHFKKFENEEGIKKALQELERKLGVSIIVTTDSTKKLDLYTPTIIQVTAK